MLSTTRHNDVDLSDRLTVSRSDLPKVLGCGLYTADEIGKRAGARIIIGRRVLYNVVKIREYLEAHSGEDVTED